jgi:hypothetical protein
MTTPATSPDLPDDEPQGKGAGHPTDEIQEPPIEAG